MTNTLKQDYTLRIAQANKTQMVVILYEMLITYVKDAEEALAAENRQDFRQALRKARSCVVELMNSLDLKYKIAEDLLNLYYFVNRELTGAELKNSAEPLAGVIFIINELRDAYAQVSGQDDSRPVMDNTQSVYAGLTYGKNHLTENLAQEPSTRGFLA